MPSTWILPRNWWCYPVRPAPSRTLNHTKLKGRNRARYPVRRFTREECADYLLQPWAGHYDFSEWDGCRGHVVEKRTLTKCDRLSAHQKAHALKLALAASLTPRSLWRALVPASDWRYRFLGRLSRRICQPVPYIEIKLPRGLFGEAKFIARDGKRKARPVPPVMDEYWHPSWRWKPDRQYYFDAWEQLRFVPRPICVRF